MRTRSIFQHAMRYKDDMPGQLRTLLLTCSTMLLANGCDGGEVCAQERRWNAPGATTHHLLRERIRTLANRPEAPCSLVIDMDLRLEESSRLYVWPGGPADAADDVEAIICSLNEQAQHETDHTCLPAPEAPPMTAQKVRSMQPGPEQAKAVMDFVKYGSIHGQSGKGAYWNFHASSRLITEQSRTSLMLERRLTSDFRHEGPLCEALEALARATAKKDEHVHSRCRYQLQRPEDDPSRGNPTVSINATARTTLREVLDQILRDAPFRLDAAIDLNSSADARRVALRWFVNAIPRESG